MQAEQKTITYKYVFRLLLWILVNCTAMAKNKSNLNHRNDAATWFFPYICALP